MQSLHMSVVLYTLNTLLCAVHGHGYLKDPPSRSSMWRFGFNTPKNFNDNELFCGGFSHQQNLGGKCGLCGDAHDQTAPRDNEAGGKYATGIISKNYTPGSTVDITVRVTANHLGFFEFRLCENNNVSKTITKECLKHLLANETGETKHYFGKLKGDIVTRVKLPENVTCSQCVLQWRYHTGNNWGTDGQGSCIGCGPQEEFYGCSDIAISSSGVTNTVSTPETSTLLAILKTSTPAAATAAETTSSTTKTTVKKQTTTLPITTTASSTESTVKTTTVPTAPTTDTAKTTTVPAAPTADTTRTMTSPSTNKLSCVSVAAPVDDTWCNNNCNHFPSYCPSQYCDCT
ncbi:uncharacterized protein LOC110463177 isoform X2 [Mizuhopecten yessoensis]|uniref:uncharacterized protein LOC110463177 isoform X2 n=1 Tax=Mizuhopecten yessoensis TaxID=6573 RepID=UPI000B45EC64|nr:uncharacterized protein LOC110463177 isoform X2 [Mizuhopecten yessoensis]